MLPGDPSSPQWLSATIVSEKDPLSDDSPGYFTKAYAYCDIGSMTGAEVLAAPVH